MFCHKWNIVKTEGWKENLHPFRIQSFYVFRKGRWGLIFTPLQCPLPDGVPIYGRNIKNKKNGTKEIQFFSVFLLEVRPHITFLKDINYIWKCTSETTVVLCAAQMADGECWMAETDCSKLNIVGCQRSQSTTNVQCWTENGEWFWHSFKTMIEHLYSSRSYLRPLIL